MSNKFLRRISVSLLVFALSERPVCAEEHQYSCPDMSQHEKVLNEGKQVDRLYPKGGTGGWIGTPPMFRVSDFVPYYNESSTLRQLEAMESAVLCMPLVSYDKRMAAISYARQYEEFGLYSTAKKLYERIVGGQKVVLDSDDDLSTARAARKGLERAELSDSAKCLVTDGKYSSGIETFGSVVEKIYSCDDDLRSKANLLRPVLRDIDRAIDAQSKVRGLTAEDVMNSQKIKARAKEISSQWKRELECLDMAEQLNRTAFRLEQHGEYEVAEKLYRQSLSIKEKNLGSADPATLIQTTELARLYAAQGRKEDACKYFDRALNAMRKLNNPPSEFATILENYGDILDRLHEPEQAEKIYAEARAFHEKVRAMK